MNLLTILLQQQGGGMSMIIMMVAIFAIMYFFMIRPQNKKQKEIQKSREALKTGDKVVIRNPWEKLTYLVEQIQIIDPNDIDKVKIQPGRDMVTLITCHPYRGHGKYRYVVYCVRSNTKMKMKKNEMSEKSASREIEEERRFRQLCGAALIVMCTLEFVSIFRRRKGARKYEQ